MFSLKNRMFDATGSRSYAPMTIVDLDLDGNMELVYESPEGKLEWQHLNSSSLYSSPVSTVDTVITHSGLNGTYA